MQSFRNDGHGNVFFDAINVTYDLDKYMNCFIVKTELFKYTKVNNKSIEDLTAIFFVYDQYIDDTFFK